MHNIMGSSDVVGDDYAAPQPFAPEPDRQPGDADAETPVFATANVNAFGAISIQASMSRSSTQRLGV